MVDFDELLSLTILSNPPVAWLTAVAVAAGVLVLLLAVRRAVRVYYRRSEQAGAGALVQIPLRVLSRTTLLFFVVLALFAGLRALALGSTIARLSVTAITIALFWQTGIWAVATVAAWFERKRKQRSAFASIGIIGVVINGVIWSFVVLLTLDNLGVDITALVAGLGIGGIAVALAVQNIFGDLFASLSIALDRPFVEGDFLAVGEVLGTVETIGIKSTRLRSLSGEQVVMPNADLLGSRVRNYGRMVERRVVFATGVAYDTPIEAIERIPRVIREIVEAQADTRFDRSHFVAHGAGILNFETVYYVCSSDYNRYMDIQQAINLRLHKEFARLGVEFAYPTQKVLVASLAMQEAA
jgi:small-conductance mechanosensitive channel